jgi:ribosomal protein S18 acetylase RimI-like enzyme
MSEALPAAITVRAATQEDAAELARLLEIFEDRSLSSAQVSDRQSAVKGIETAFLAIAGVKVIGLASLRLVPCLSASPPHAEITELYVEKDYQGKQVEQALLEKVETQASQQGAKELTLLTGLRNTGAQSLYRSLGYRDYALAMRKHL